MLNLIFQTITYSFWALVIVFLPIIIFTIFKEIIAYLSLKYYKRQGIDTYYFPIIGLNRYTKRISNEKQYQFNKKMTNFDEKKLIAGNPTWGTSPRILLIDPNLIKDFLVKESDHFKRQSIPNTTTKPEGFFFENGHKAMEIRSIFSKFFEAANIKSIIKSIEEIFDRKFNEILVDLEKRDPSNKEWQKLDFKPVLKESFDELVNVVLFGDYRRENIPTYEGKIYSEAINERIKEQIRIARMPIHIMTQWVLHKANIFPSSKKLLKKDRKIRKTTYEYYLKREKEVESGKWKLGVNIVDLLVQHNLNCEKKDRFNENFIVDNLQIFYIAGTDTSKANSTSAIFTLSDRPDIQEKLVESLKKDMKVDENGITDYESCPYLNYFIYESLRRYSPADGLFTRHCIKDCSIGPYKVKKGARVSVLLTWLNNSKTAYEDPYEFRPERFEDRNAHKRLMRDLNYVPFGAGRRACIGKYLGELMIKIVIRKLLERFELKRDEDFEPKWVTKFTLELETVKVLVRKRKL